MTDDGRISKTPFQWFRYWLLIFLLQLGAGYAGNRGFSAITGKEFESPSMFGIAVGSAGMIALFIYANKRGWIKIYEREP